MMSSSPAPPALLTTEAMTGFFIIVNPVWRSGIVFSAWLAFLVAVLFDRKEETAQVGDAMFRYVPLKIVQHHLGRWRGDRLNIYASAGGWEYCNMSQTKRVNIKMAQSSIDIYRYHVHPRDTFPPA
jgi:hypothetical protein